MELISAFVCQLLFFIFCEGFKISSKLIFDGDSEKDSDFLSHGYNKTGSKDTAESDEDPRIKSYEAKVPFLLSKKKDGYEIKIPLTIEEEKITEANNKITFLSGFDLFERRSTTETEETAIKTTTRTVPIVKGSLSHVKPDFLIAIPHKPTTASPFTKESHIFNNIWPDRILHEDKKSIEGLKPPAPVVNQWILNTTPFLSFPRNTTSRPSLAPTANSNKLSEPSLWHILESGSWNPSSWNQNQKSYWIRKPGWTDKSHNYQTNHPRYYTPNVRYPVSHSPTWNTYQELGGKLPPRGNWIACPPFEVNDVGPSARNAIPGCPQYHSARPPDVEIINVTPVVAINDKTSFKDFVGKPDTSSEEPKTGH